MPKRQNIRFFHLRLWIEDLLCEWISQIRTHIYDTFEKCFACVSSNGHAHMWAHTPNPKTAQKQHVHNSPKDEWALCNIHFYLVRCHLKHIHFVGKCSKCVRLCLPFFSSSGCVMCCSTGICSPALRMCNDPCRIGLYAPTVFPFCLCATDDVCESQYPANFITQFYP